MPTRSHVAPSTVGVRLDEGGVFVKYVDGREVLYHGVPEKVAGSLRSQPGKDIHVLVTDETETRGVLVYVDDRKTHDEILEDSGVGRVLLADAEREELFPGVVAERDGLNYLVEVDPDLVDGRVFVFVEDQFGEASYEIVPEGEVEAGEREGEGEVEIDEGEREADGAGPTVDEAGDGADGAGPTIDGTGDGADGAGSTVDEAGDGADGAGPTIDEAGDGADEAGGA